MDAAEEALAHAHIGTLLSLYCQAIDVGDFDTLEHEVMAEDATWEVVQHASSGRVEDGASGRDAVIAWFRKMMSGEVSMSEGTVRHFLNTHVIRVAADGRSATSTSHLLAADTVTMAILSNGFATAEHVRTDRGWRIRRYHIDERITDADMKAYQETFGLEAS